MSKPNPKNKGNQGKLHHALTAKGKPLSGYAAIIAAMLEDPARREEFFATRPGLALAKALHEIAASIAGVQATDDPVIELLSYSVRKQRLTAISIHEFLTNDLVEIKGAFTRRRGNELRVNDRPVSLDRREYMLVRVLADYALKNWRRDPRLQSDADGFMPVDEILAAFERLKGAHPELRGLWKDAIYTAIHQVVGRLRDKLAQAKLNRFLIESGPGGAGYRLSTAPSNLTVTIGEARKA